MGNLDENDHLTVGYLMTEGRLLYKDIFSHHFPFPYYWTYLFTFLWSDGNPSRTISIFRLSLTVLQLIIFATVFILSQKKITKILFSFWIILFSLFYSLYQGNLILSESFGAVFIAGYTWILLPILFIWEKYHFGKGIALIMLAALSFWTQPLYGLLYIIPFFFKQKREEKLKLVFISVSTVLIPLVILWANHKLTDFIEQAVWFNYRVYPKPFFNYIHPHSTLPPILLTVILFFQNEFKLFTSVSNWLQIFQFITHVSVYVILFTLIKRKEYMYSLIFILLLATSRLREIKVVAGVPFNFGIYPFIVIGSICAGMLLYSLFKKHKVSAIVLGLTLVLSAAIPMKPIFLQSLDRSYNYNVFWSPKQQIGQTIQSLTHSNETILVYPHDVDLYYFAQRLPPDRFLYWFPWIDIVEKYKKERLYALKNNSPAVIYTGSFTHLENKNYYAQFFPNLTNGYIQIKKENKPTGIWLREDLQERLTE